MKEKALEFAKMAHEGQKRKYLGEDYVVHPMRVAALIEHYISPSCSTDGAEYVVSAAYLHDVIEDCDFCYMDIAERFGPGVADLVMEVTNPSIGSGENRKVRKEMDLKHLANSGYFGASIKLADMIDNIPSIVAYDPGFAKTYLKEKLKVLDVLKHGHPELYRIAKATVEKGMEQLES